MAKKRFHSNESYAGFEGKKGQEASDSGMISEDRSKIANLPTEVMFKKYPEVAYYSYDLDDTQKVVNNQRNSDVHGGKNKTNKEYPEKF